MSATDPVTLAAVAAVAVFVLVTLAASYCSRGARRAAHVDPVTALRGD